MTGPAFFWKDEMLRSGLIGRAIGSSRSPWLHEQEAQAQGLELGYALFDFDALGLPDSELAPLLADLSARGYCGVNVTYPFKQSVMPLLDELAESAAMVGAVNTIEIRDGRLTGHNTDMAGFRDSVRSGLAGAEMDAVLQLGAGGAGAAVAAALLALGANKLYIHDIDGARAGALADALNTRTGKQSCFACVHPADVVAEVNGIVNATPMGMAANPQSAIDPTLLVPRHWVADIVYFPLETELLRRAREAGCRILDGSGMVINQAAKAFEIMTGYPANEERMRASFLAKP